MIKINPYKALNPAYRKHKPLPNEVLSFIEQLKECIKIIKLSDDNNEREEHIKEPIKKFFQSTFYGENLINTRNNIDLAIYLDKTIKSDVGVIIEAKRSSNKKEFISPDNLNKKALHELLLYYFRERIDNKNNNIKHLIATNGLEWFFFKAEDFYNIFYKNRSLVKEYEQFRDGLKDTTKNEIFYDEIAKKHIDSIQDQLPFVHIDFTKTDFDKLNDNELNTYYKIFSNVHLLGHSFGNDSNQLNKNFYNELLHIIGLEEVPAGSKKVIDRKTEKTRDYASLLENTIFTLEEGDKLRNVKSIENGANKSFNIGLELCLTWINRVLFLKLLESQLTSYHKGAKEYRFLNTSFIHGYDELNRLFFSALAQKVDERNPRYAEKFKNIPYLNSSLFERTEIETVTFDISALIDDEMKVYSNTVLKDVNGKKFKGKLTTLDYLFKFLDAYDFTNDGTEVITDSQENKTLINASVLGLIFEKINGYKDGSFYTPAYITMYMCRETIRKAVIQKFKELENDTIETFEDVKVYCHRFFQLEKTKHFNSIVNSLRICDPAVGSGHFLVSALNELISIKNDLGILVDANGIPLRVDIQIENDELYISDAIGKLFEYSPNDPESARVQKALFEEKQTLIENCLFGVDINPNSVKICRLRLWIELLKNAYYRTDSNELETLPNIDINIKCGNSLISRFELDTNLKEALKKSKLSIDAYKNAVNTYRNADSKEQKREMEVLIGEIKTNFRSEINANSKEIKDLIKDQNEYYTKYESAQLFEAPLNKAQVKNKKELAEKIKKKENAIEEIKSNKIYENAFEWRFEFPDILNDDGDFVGFDVIIGNPPYLQLSKTEDITNAHKNYLLETYQTSGGRLNTFIFFIHLSNRILHSNGFQHFIVPNTILSQEYYSFTRDFLVNKVSLTEIVNFPTLPFEDAVVETVLIQYANSPNLVNSIEVKELSKEKLSSVSKLERDVINRDSKYSFVYDLDPVIEKIFEREHDTFGSICEINQGIALKGDRSLSLKDSKENDNCFKLLDGRNINKYSIRWDNVYIDYDIDKIHSCKRKDIFESNEKLMFRRVSSSLIFTYDNEQFFALNTLVVVNKIDNKIGPDLKFILGLMNSKLTNYVYSNKFKSTKKVFSEIQAGSVKELPIPKNNSGIEQQMVELVDKLIYLKKLNNDLSEIEEVEKQIDLLVYQLYDLTKEEIIIIENK
jgi:adenine-specific DNA-methyltransferase